MNYNRFINRRSARREESKLRSLPRIYAASPPGTVFMGGGMPNTATFPFSKFDVELKDGTKMTIEGKSLEAALQYQPTQGYPPLVKQMKDLLSRVHGLGPNFWDKNDLLVTTGSLDGICRTFDMCLEEGEPVIYTEPSFSGVADALKPYIPRMLAVGQDEFGMCPKKLRAVLADEGSPELVRSKFTGVPKLLYVNPTGSNPSGTTIPKSRKEEIYKLACEYDFLIIEDDPYYFLHFDKANPDSFLSLDTEGRVLRFDSFSKVMSAGLRLGFTTGPKPLIERLDLHMQVSTMHTSGLPQVVVSELISLWGPERLDQHFTFIQDFYRGQRDCMLAAANKYLKGLAEWTVPTGGMFMWIKVIGLADVRTMLGAEASKKGVIVVSGAQLMVDESAPCPYFRASFSSAKPEELDLGFSRLAELIKVSVARREKLQYMTA